MYQDKNVVADWLTGNRQTGLRGLDYDENFFDTYASVGKGRYMWPHAIDEIWCATSLQMNRNIQKQLGRIRIRVILGLLLVVDAKKRLLYQ